MKVRVEMNYGSRKIAESIRNKDIPIIDSILGEEDNPESKRTGGSKSFSVK